MAIANDISAPLRHANRFFIGGEWVEPSSDALIDVIDSTSEQLFFSVAEAKAPDMARAVAAARQAFDEGPWPRLSHEQRAEYLRAIATELEGRTEDVGQIWPRESGVLHVIAKGLAEGATLATGGGRPEHLDRGWFIEPTVFGNVDNSSTIAQEEIFGPVLSVIPADNEQQAIAIANDTIYGLNASVFTNDVDRARDVARQLRSGTVGHNAFRTDFGIAFGGFKQSGIGREGGTEGLHPFLETKTVILEGRPAAY